MIHIRTQVKTRQSQSYKLKKIAKNVNFDILQETLQATHLLKILDKMHKYEKDPTRTVGSTERTRDAGRMDRQKDGRTDGVKPIYPPTTSLCGGYNEKCLSVGKRTSSKFVHWWPLILRIIQKAMYLQIDRLVQERHDFIANALELRLSCTSLLKRNQDFAYRLKEHESASGSSPGVGY